MDYGSAGAQAEVPVTRGRAGGVGARRAVLLGGRQEGEPQPLPLEGGGVA